MGKWTPNYIDEVLNQKMSTLVTGAIRRAAIEKEPSISYENFVTELDTGDSFTTTLIDILVKELAERRTRSASDRRYIAERTARSLRRLTEALNVYRRPRIYATRRPMGGAFYPMAPSNGMVVDGEYDEDEFESMLDNTEGAHMSSAELYEAMGLYYPALTRRNYTASPLEGSSSNPPIPPLRSPTARMSPWTVVPAPSTSATSLARQSSIRRPTRTRTSDFSDFTRRQRSSLRASATARSSEAPEGVTEPRESSSTRSLSSAPRPMTSSSTRRFFHNRLRPIDTSTANPSSWSEHADASGEDDVLGYINIEQTTGGAGASTAASVRADLANWFRDPSPASPPIPTSATAETSEERIVIGAPRLRRGGIRAPESMLSRHASPVNMSEQGVDPSAIAGSTTPATSTTTSMTLTTATAFARPADSEEPAAYPTPGSVDNENVA